MANRASLTAVSCLFLVLALTGCGSSARTDAGGRGHPDRAPAGSPGSPGSPASRLPSDQGPFAGSSWRPQTIPVGSLLHDDGSRLWAYAPSGRRSLVWSHPRAPVYELAADAGGKTIAMVVGSSEIDGAYLYLLEPDGSVVPVRRVGGGWDIWAPIFAKAPTRPRGPTRIYWTEHSAGEFDPATDTPIMRTMTFDGRRVGPVGVPLLWGQAPWRLDGYPGNSTMSLTLFRRANVPTFHEVLRNDDLTSGGDDSSPTELGYWQEITNTGSETGVAWLLPDRYVVQVGKSAPGDGEIRRSSLVLYRVGCEFRGGETLWSGSAVDPGTFHAYPILAPDRGHVLVLRKVAGSAGKRRPTGWMSLDVRTGDLSPSPIRWSPGPWSAVRAPAEPSSGGPDCSGFDGTWP